MEDFFAYRLIIEVIQGVHLSPLGFAACQSKKCTNRTECFYFVGALETSAPPKNYFFTTLCVRPLNFTMYAPR
jgi:hypothetical protein